MVCPYFRESYFGICVAHVAHDAIHVPSIDEMERFCFRSLYSACPKIPALKESGNSGKSYIANGLIH
jgi:hypothetical protein